jgi:hypothetical protein
MDTLGAPFQSMTSTACCSTKRPETEPQRSTDLSKGSYRKRDFLSTVSTSRARALGSFPDIQEPLTDGPIRSRLGLDAIRSFRVKVSPRSIVGIGFSKLPIAP